MRLTSNKEENVYMVSNKKANVRHRIDTAHK